jgi:aryl-alcohol dehydrogenase-like predicted oxidoreductase
VASALGESRAALEGGRATALGVRLVGGRATAAATRARATEIARTFGESAVAAFGTTGLTVSRLGFGCYRVDARATPHREALTRALTQGVNLVDTSTNYADGFSERLVGEVVRDLRASGAVQREAMVLVSKVGYAQGSNLKVAEDRKAAGHPFPEMVEYAAGLWHCIHPDWIEEQLGRSLERLGVETLDVCLLHNPEYFLGHAAKQGAPLEASRAEFQRRVTEAFRHLESEVRRGRIAFYGVSSNTLGDAEDDPETTRLARFLSAARAAGGEGHHFRVLQVPLNLLETGPALRKGTGESGEETLLEAAARHGLAVLVNRPLNAIVEGQLVRLADPPELPDAPAFGEALAAVRDLEREFGGTFATSLEVSEESGLRPDQLLKWAEQLGDFAVDVKSFEQWRDTETHAIAPRIMQVISALDRAFAGPMAERWAAFRERYVSAMDGLLRAIRKRAADRSRRRTLALARAIDPTLPEERRAAPLSRKALFALESLPGVTTVLVGMREPRYVDDALAAMGWQAAPSATRILEAAAKAEVG